MCTIYKSEGQGELKTLGNGGRNIASWPTFSYSWKIIEFITLFKAKPCIFR